MAEHDELGREGEALALKHLKSKGYTILETNWHFGRNEIDIIAQDGECIVIVEVKTRSSGYLIEPQMAVTKSKQSILIRAANAYIRKKNIDLEGRFDIISIVVAKGQAKIEHIEDAFYPTL